MEESERLRNEIGSIPVMKGGCATDDNVAIAMATYFESLPDCPDDDTNDEIGWSQWAVDNTNDVIDRIIAKSNQHFSERIEFLKNQIADLNRCCHLLEHENAKLQKARRNEQAGTQ